MPIAALCAVFSACARADRFSVETFCPVGALAKRRAGRPFASGRGAARMAWILHLPRKIPTYASGSDAVPPIPAARARGIAIEKKGGF
ncbi:hypothetical protein NUV26_27635 [Burkholderia pseudomultivorans]|uniref:hypothetical protein n=1 Tax=Burkholderia pseudomultivorans TaxID=1207504 RepID=UPI0002D93814|nr:hypothetical protein [Burkholderia pseudomultivorans]MDS0795949.1 hypothetical protein [Burkholderia pseudomultivorans]MDS0857772.1 hypothetical protein [Burkholderia pseudomultivorans]